MSKLSVESDALHSACMQAAKEETDPSSKKFSQADLQQHAKNCSSSELMSMVTELTQHLLLRAFKQTGGGSNGLSWSVRTKEAASNLAKLPESDRIVYTLIEDSGIAGVWLKKIKSSTNVPPNEVQKAIGKLEKHQLIKGIKSIKNPTQRIYMLFHLAPSDDVTGGSLFDEAELDESMVEELSNLIIFHVRQESWIDSRRRTRRGSSFVGDDSDRKRKRAVESIEHDEARPNGKHQGGVIIEDDSDSHQSKRRRHDKATVSDDKTHSRQGTADIEDVAIVPRQNARRRASDAHNTQLAHPAGTKEYPSTESILTFLKSSNAIREDKAQRLTYDEVQSLIDVLVWDEKLEKIRGGYRTVRGVQPHLLGSTDYDYGDTRGNGLTEVPCGRCQLFDLCQEGSKVSAATCVYYQDWLKT